jgi:murein DD-endopeptidase MepM/ murein hydrolase activator NlpD
MSEGHVSVHHTHRFGGIGITVAVLLAAWNVFAAGTRAQQIGRTAVEVQMLQAPAEVVALGRVHIVYELHTTNFGTAAVSLEQLEVLGGDAVLASWTGPQLWQRTVVIGQPPAPPGAARALAPGARGVTYAWLSLPPGQRAPVALSHRLTVSQADTTRDTVTSRAIAIAPQGAALVAPVAGGPWVAVRGPSNSSPHRLALVTADGRVRIPQRFAVDWARLGDDGLLFRGDGKDIADWYGFDEPVQAVAGGVVALVRDGQNDHPALGAPPPAIMEAGDATGNVVVLDIGNGRFATYAHLKSGSVRVSEGDRVVEGQVIAQIGNSGNTLGPHLHFQISDAREPLAGEGLPFAFQHFNLLGRVAAFPALLSGTPWSPSASETARTVTSEMPLDNMVVRLGE